MGKVYERIDDRLRDFIAAQPLFFVATAPRDGGHVNVSPKGYAGTFTVLDDHRVAYLDLHGSGAETIAHLRENGRITVMFCSFDRQPKIVRLHGTGSVELPGSPLFEEYAGHFDVTDHTRRAVIVVSVTRISDSCGYAVPEMELVSERAMLKDWATRKSPESLAAYRAERNATRIDGLPALP